MKKKYLIILIVALLAIFVIWSLSSSKLKTITGEISTKGQYSSESVKRVTEDRGVGKWGFGLNGSSICFVDSAGINLMRYDMASGKKEILKTLSAQIEAANIQSNGDSCLYQLITDQRVLTVLYNSDGVEELKGYQRGVIENNGNYVLQDQEAFIVIDGSGNEVKSIPNTEGNIFAVAPTPEKTFLVSDYDFELRKGKIVAQQDINNQIVPAENITTIRALGPSFLLINQIESSFTANLFNGSSKILELSGIDPDLIKTIPAGYLAVTKENAENPERDSNGLVFIGQNGTYQTIIHSIESSEEQFLINSFAYSKGVIYFSNGEKVMSLKVDF